MMNRHFRLSSELSGAITKRPPHAKIHLSVPGSFFNQFVMDIYIYRVYIYMYIYIYIYIHINRVLIVRIPVNNLIRWCYYEKYECLLILCNNTTNWCSQIN